MDIHPTPTSVTGLGGGSSFSSSSLFLLFVAGGPNKRKRIELIQSILFPIYPSPFLTHWFIIRLFKLRGGRSIFILKKKKKKKKKGKKIAKCNLLKCALEGEKSKFKKNTVMTSRRGGNCQLQGWLRRSSNLSWGANSEAVCFFLIYIGFG